MLIAAYLIGGLLLLFVGGEALIRGAVSLAKKFSVPPLIIGLTIVSYGTSMPELIVSLQANLNGISTLAVGNIAGSNITNVLLVLGVTALIFPISTDETLLKREAPFLILVTVLFIFFGLTGSIIPLEGAALIFLLLFYTVYIFYVAQRDKSALPEHQVAETEEQLNINESWFVGLVYTPIGLLMLAVGADFFVIGAGDLARIFGVSEAIIGLTIAAFGTSAPELFAAVMAAFRKHADLALGNVVGSNLFNLLGVGGVVPMFGALQVSDNFILVDFWVLLLVTCLLAYVMISKHKITRVEGGVMFAGYIAYMIYLYSG